MAVLASYQEMPKTKRSRRRKVRRARPIWVQRTNDGIEEEQAAALIAKRRIHLVRTFFDLLEQPLDDKRRAAGRRPGGQADRRWCAAPAAVRCVCAWADSRRGHGRAARPAGRPGAADALGVSDGGPIALDLAAIDPRVERVVLVARCQRELPRPRRCLRTSCTISSISSKDYGLVFRRSLIPADVHPRPAAFVGDRLPG